MIEVLATIAMLVGLLDVLIMTVIIIKDLFDF